MVQHFHNLKTVNTAIANHGLNVDISKAFYMNIHCFCFTATNGLPYMYRGSAKVLANGIFMNTSDMHVSYGTGHLFHINGHNPHLHGDITQWIAQTAVDNNFEALVVLTENGYVLGAGDNYNGWLAQGNTTDVTQELVEIYDPTDYSNDHATKVRHTFGHAQPTANYGQTLYILTAGGKIYASGDGNHGKLGQGSTSDSNTLIHTQDGSGTVSNWVDFETSFGDDTTAAIAVKSDGSWYSLGDGTTYITGEGNTSTDRTTWTAISELPSSKTVSDIKIIGSWARAAAFVLFTDGTLYGCGSNSRGVMDQGDTTDLSTYTQLDTGVDEIFVHMNNRNSATEVETLIYRKGTTYYLNGYDAYNQSMTDPGNDGNRTTTVTMGTALPTGFAIEKIFKPTSGNSSLSEYFSIAKNSTTNEHRVYYHGSNSYGQMGNGTTTHASNSDLDSNEITKYLPCHAKDIIHMEMTYTLSMYMIAWCIDKFGNVYATGTKRGWQTGTTYNAQYDHFPFRGAATRDHSKIWQRVTPFIEGNSRED